jgi:hypothetical protein
MGFKPCVPKAITHQVFQLPSRPKRSLAGS